MKLILSIIYIVLLLLHYDTFKKFCIKNNCQNIYTIITNSRSLAENDTFVLIDNQTPNNNLSTNSNDSNNETDEGLSFFNEILGKELIFLNSKWCESNKFDKIYTNIKKYKYDILNTDYKKVFTNENNVIYKYMKNIFEDKNVECKYFIGKINNSLDNLKNKVVYIFTNTDVFITTLYSITHKIINSIFSVITGGITSVVLTQLFYFLKGLWSVHPILSIFLLTITSLFIYMIAVIVQTLNS
ncbi:exported protein (hyp13) [Plasmodium gaboni]|uniref:Exported protein (Hyp13) n=1 Tax=Plasmodium gaboni TaxID=647221 RepID=A0A151L2N2_9APIC|nr:exported protein (hyp13) [Plasmodium gaboni]KYN93223.1 exported protein (hyp13) [Plasmodium gaboni]